MWLTHVPDGGTQRAVKRARGSISCSLKGFLSSYHKRGPSFPRQIPIDCADGGYVRTVEAQLVKQIDLGIHSAKLKVGFRGDSILNFRTMAKSSKSNRTRTCQEHLETVFSSVFGPCDIDHQAWAGARVAEITKFIREGPSFDFLCKKSLRHARRAASLSILLGRRRPGSTRNLQNIDDLQRGQLEPLSRVQAGVHGNPAQRDATNDLRARGVTWVALEVRDSNRDAYAGELDAVRDKIIRCARHAFVSEVSCVDAWSTGSQPRNGAPCAKLLQSRWNSTGWHQCRRLSLPLDSRLNHIRGTCGNRPCAMTLASVQMDAHFVCSIGGCLPPDIAGHAVKLVNTKSDLPVHLPPFR